MDTVIEMPVLTEKKVDTRRVLIFLAFAFGIAWLAGLAVYLTGGLVNSQEIISGTGITVAALLLPVVYMGAPAIAHVLTRLVTQEGWKNVGLRPNFRKGWPYWLMAWFGPVVLMLVGAAVLYKPDWFYPAAMIVVGSHYLPFLTLYGMKLFGFLAGILVIAGAGLALYGPPIFSLGGWLTGVVLLAFAIAGRQIVLQEEKQGNRSSSLR